MHKIISKTICCALVISIAGLFSAAETLAAQECQNQCTVDTKFGPITIAIVPDDNNQWPVVVEAPPINTDGFRCDDPSSPDPDNYPCFAWPYQCLSGPCEKITKGNILIPNCCDKPIEILWTSHGNPITDIITCDDTSSLFPNVCSGYELELPNNAGSNPGIIFWFTTPVGIGTNMIDITIPIQSKPTTCLTGIKGPGCNTPVPPVRVEARTQCWQFNADVDPCRKETTWYAEWEESDPCAVRVFACTGIVSCSDVRGKALDASDPQCEELAAQPLTTISDDDGQVLTALEIGNNQCSAAFLRLIDPDTLCNKTCYKSGGVKYCY